MSLDPLLVIFDGRHPVSLLLFWIFAAAVIWCFWRFLTQWRSAKWYPPVWWVLVAFFSSWWGGALVNALQVGNGTPGNGWDAFGAAIFFLLSTPALVIDIILFLRWPKRAKAVANLGDAIDQGQAGD
jgi:hypothetical protein